MQASLDESTTRRKSTIQVLTRYFPSGSIQQKHPRRPAMTDARRYDEGDHDNAKTDSEASRSQLLPQRRNEHTSTLLHLSATRWCNYIPRKCLVKSTFRADNRTGSHFLTPFPFTLTGRRNLGKSIILHGRHFFLGEYGPLKAKTRKTFAFLPRSSQKRGLGKISVEG